MAAAALREAGLEVLSEEDLATWPGQEPMLRSRR
jgi:hypothetical protein